MATSGSPIPGSPLWQEGPITGVARHAGDRRARPRGGRLRLGVPERSALASVSPYDRSTLAPPEAVIDADQDLIDTLLHVFLESEAAVIEQEVFSLGAKPHMVVFDPD